MKMIYLEYDSQINEIIKNKKYSKFLLQFSATWCPPCVRITPDIQNFVQSLTDTEAIYIYCDVDKCPSIYDYMDLNGIPGFVTIIRNKNDLFDVEKLSSSDLNDIRAFCKKTGFLSLENTSTTNLKM